MKQIRTLGAAAALISAVTLSTTAIAQSTKDLVKEDGVYTLVNLHPDEGNRRLYAVNYQQPGLIPVCTQVKITKMSRKAIIFEIPERNNRKYEYLHYKKLPESLDEHGTQIFGKTCPKDAIAKMSKIDQEGIKEGIAKVGMTKAGVLIAMGPPPSHATYSQDLDEWMYWQHKFARLRVDFKDGKVSEVVD
ncbi:lipoprotein [Aurantivibrio infirmus]